MHARFNLDPGKESWSAYFEAGDVIHKANKVIVETDLEKFKNADGILQANEIIENWFPRIQANVFLSHSHKDEKLVIGLAGWLKQKFGLKSFIDSTVWGYSGKLLRAIDNKYCKNKSGDTYRYDLRNRSTSHVHMMLSMALADMIHRSECIIFISTGNSFKPVDYLNGEGKTESPWIYSEIALTRMIQRRSAREHRLKPAMESVEASVKKRAEDLRVEYPLDTFHLTPLNISDLSKWDHEYSKTPMYAKWASEPAQSLDTLYNIKKLR